MAGRSQVPLDLFYSDSHTWVLIEGDDGVIGMSDFAQDELSEIVYVELPAVGDDIVQGVPFGTIEAMKTVAELIAPVSGKVIEINDDVVEHPKLINTDPYSDGWMIRVQLSDPEEVYSIMSPEDYQEFIEEQ